MNKKLLCMTLVFALALSLFALQAPAQAWP